VVPRPVLAAALGLLVSACGAPQPEPGPNVFLISLDTVRRDAVGVYRGSGPSPTPEIDAFAASCVRFDQAWAPVPFTPSSHMSMFTGLHPITHRISSRDAVLTDRIPTVAELASDAGYRTLGLVSNIWMKGEFGFARGFDHYERISFGLTYADRVNERVFELLDARAVDDDRPVFGFLHYIDAHSDYDRVDLNLLPYSAPPERLDELGLTPTSTDFCDDDGNCGTKFLTAANRTGRPIDAATIARIEALYMAGVELLDVRIGELLRGLDDRGLLDGAYVIITSDHGEEFREHGRFVHAQPYVECLAVPLLVRLPGGVHGGTVIDQPVELADLMPTVLGAMGIDPPPHVPARNLLELLETERHHAERSILGADKNRRDRFSLRRGRSTLIADLGSGRRELYDRAADPGELVDRSADDPETVAELEAELVALLERSRALGDLLWAGDVERRTDTLSSEEADQLRAIGYLD
jgi:arylsulfatase A-like enzyme